jgi:hypothetical protein
LPSTAGYPSFESPNNTKSMTLADLKRQVDTAIENAIERNESPDEIPVTLQLEKQGDGAIWGHEDCELRYDGGLFATDCVIVAWISEDNTQTMAGEALPSVDGSASSEL